NLIVCGDRRVVVLDFGIAKLTDALAGELTASHQAVGTPTTMAPEQIRGGAIDARTDVYALGGLLFLLLAGRLPFETSSPTMVQYFHLHARRPRASAFAAVPSRIDDVIARAMAIRPAERFESPATLVAAYRAALRESTAVPVAAIADACVIVVVARDA